MNIFFSSTCPVDCAKYLDDKRVVKMCTETAQMLSTAIRLVTDYPHKDEVMKSTHANHPSNVWIRQSKQNFEWAYKHFLALNDEYTLRYGKVHKTMEHAHHFKAAINLLPDIGLTKFANCAARTDMGISFKHLDDVCDAYKKYLDIRWQHDKREPTWYKQKRN